MRVVMLKLLTAVVALTALSLSPSDVPGQSQASDPLVGIWAGETAVAPVLRGELVVTRNGSDWRATVGSVSTAFLAHGASIRFSPRRDLGIFRGAITKGAGTIYGLWIQHTGVVYGNPMAST